MMMMAATAVTPVLEKPVSWCTYPTLVCCLSLFFFLFFLSSDQFDLADRCVRRLLENVSI